MMAAMALHLVESSSGDESARASLELDTPPTDIPGWPPPGTVAVLHITNGVESCGYAATRRDLECLREWINQQLGAWIMTRWVVADVMPGDAPRDDFRVVDADGDSELVAERDDDRILIHSRTGVEWTGIALGPADRHEFAAWLLADC